MKRKRPTLSPSPGTPGEGRGEGDFEHQRRSTNPITLTLTLSRSTGRGDQNQTTSADKEFIPYLRRHVRAAHRLLNPPLTDLSIALVNDRQMSHLHQQFMNLPGPTDVLTFPLDLDNLGQPLSGEIILCVPEARRRAAEHHIPPRQELLLYALHGLLHLCGYDDRTDPDYRRMHQKEDAILTQLGVGATFAPTTAVRKKR